jgi:hypothetical protein
MSDLSDVEQAIVDSATGAAESTNLAGERVKLHPLPDLLAAKKDLERKTSASSGRLPIRFFKIRPPGAV